MILQFGTGNFLRGFVDLFIDELDRGKETSLGPVIAVQSTGRDRAVAINAAHGRYHVAIQGYQKGRVIDETVEVCSIREALHTGTQWEQVVEVARQSDLIAILSNTTEAGLVLSERDIALPVGGTAPVSYPGKLLVCLRARFESGQPGPWIIPCELIEANGDRLRQLVLNQAELWQFGDELSAWIKNDCRWVNTVVDRIVPGLPKAHSLLGTDPLLISCEPFAFWAVETDRTDFPFASHPAVTLAADIAPFTLRKVRILNGAHTALVARALNSPLRTVGDCLNDPETSDWLERLLFEEIVPTLEGRCDEPAAFACATLDRFRNPFLDHQLSAIALHHETKMEVRLRPTLNEHRDRFGKEPGLLADLLR